MERLIALAAGKADDAEINWRRLGGAVVRISDDAARVYICLALEAARPVYEDGRALLEPDEVIIADQHRDECNRLLQEVCPSKVEWLDLVYLATDSEAFGAAFIEVHAEQTGLADPATSLSETQPDGASPPPMIAAASLLAALGREEE